MYNTYSYNKNNFNNNLLSKSENLGNFNTNYNNNNLRLPPINNTTFYNRSNLTVAPEIPTYYKQNINKGNYYSHLPNILGNQGNEIYIAKGFSNNLKKLQDLENRIHERSNLEIIPEEENLKNNLQKNANQIMFNSDMKNLYKNNNNNNENNNENNDLKVKFNEMKQIKSTFPEKNEEEEEKYSNDSKYLMSKEGMKNYKNELFLSLNEFSNEIKNQLDNEYKKNKNFYNIIEQNLISVKNELENKINKFNETKDKNLDDIKNIIMKNNKDRMKKISERILPRTEINKLIEEQEKQMNELKKKEKENLKRMSVLIMNRGNDLKNENILEENKKLEENKSQLINNIKNNNINETNNNNINNNLIPSSNKISLDFYEKYSQEKIEIYEKISEKLILYKNKINTLYPLNKFRSYVFLIIAARRILNVQFILYKHIKFDVIKYFLLYFEDMDIIIKKLIYNSVRRPLLLILKNKHVDLNIAIEKENAKEIFLDIKEFIEAIIKGFNTIFFNGISENILSFLALFVSNFSFIYQDFFTTFELIRFDTTKTGDFINLNNNQRKMILAFYLFIKILLKNIFLELIFNQNCIKNLNKKSKLNIKMIVSILYRGLINYFKENVDAIKNVEELEKINDINNFMKINFKRKEFKFNKLLKKRYYLKTSHIEQKNHKRASIRNKKKIDEDEEKRSKRKTKKLREKIKKKRNKRKNSESSESSEESSESSEESSSNSYESEENSDSENSYSNSKYLNDKSSSSNSYYEDEEQSNSKIHNVKDHLLGKKPITKVIISDIKPLQQGKNVLIDLEKEDVENMHTIIENSQSFGNDIDPDEVKIMNNVLYDENSLEIYYLYAEEYNFDPIKNLIDVVEDLLNKIENNFNNKFIKYYDDNEYINIY